MIMFKVFSCLARSYNETAVRNTLVVTVQFFLRNEMHRCVIFIEIVFHCNYLFFNSFKIRAGFGNNKTLSCVLLSCCKFRLRTASYCIKCGFNGNCILPCINNTVNSSYCIAVTLADTLSPERVIRAVGKNTTAVKSVYGEHTGVPAHRNNADFIAFFCGGINIAEMLGNSFMSVKTVNNIEIFRHSGSLFGQIRCTSSAHYKNINIIPVV